MNHHGSNFNPTVEPQRHGYCLYNESLRKWFVSITRWGTHKEARVETEYSEALRLSRIFGLIITTVPRFNGHCYEWETVK